MIEISSLPPAPFLAGLVRNYRMSTANTIVTGIRVPLMASADLELDFYFTRSNFVEARRTGARERPPSAVIIGPRTLRHGDVVIDGTVDIFTVKFEATGLHRLFRLAMPELADAVVDAGHIFGHADIVELHERMAQHQTLFGRAQIMENYLRKHVTDTPTDPIAATIAMLQSSAGGARIEQLSRESGYSPRHFNRLFKERVGISPKSYARIVRLNAVLAAKGIHPAFSWAELAHEYGYFDQSHLDKDFLDLADDTPSGLCSSLICPLEKWTIHHPRRFT